MTIVTWWIASGKTSPENPSLLSHREDLFSDSVLKRGFKSGELQWIADKEYRCIVTYEVPVSLLPYKILQQSHEYRVLHQPHHAHRQRWRNVRITAFCLPTSEKIFAFVYFVISLVTVKLPNAPDPLACMRRSGITSRSKWLVSP